MKDELKKLLPDLDEVSRYIPLALGSLLCLFFGIGWLGVPLLLLAFFFPRLFKLIYATFVFMFLGTLFTLMGFLFAVSADWLPWSMASWWKVAHWISIPTALYSVYLSGDIQTFSNKNKP